MTETILIFNAPPKPVLLKIQKVLLPLRVRIRTISREYYNQPIGSFAGMKNIISEPKVTDEGELAAPFFVFCFLSDQKLDQVLAALRRCGAGPFPYKAILTPANCEWTAYECFEEIRKEHEKMHGGA